MALLKIARMGHPILLGTAAPVARPDAPEMRRLVADMRETLADSGGIGLAAPQIHQPLRLFLWHDGAAVQALFNPVIEPLGEERATAWEGCLSIPGLRGLVERPARVRWSGLDEAGVPVSGEAEGIAARVLQHENDHLDGMFYLSRMPDLGRLGFVEELARAMESRA